MTSLDETARKVREWGIEKGINNPLMQYAKVTEEVAEIAHELTRGRAGNGNPPSPETIDAIGDALVTIVILANILGIDVNHAFEAAYNVIKDRTGRNINGSFVKDV